MALEADLEGAFDWASEGALEGGKLRCMGRGFLGVGGVATENISLG